MGAETEFLEAALCSCCEAMSMRLWGERGALGSSV